MKFCRSYQVGEECKFGAKCKKIHGFTLDDNIKRLSFQRNIPSDENTKLGTFMHENKRYFTLKMGDSVTIFEYNFMTNSINDLNTFKLPLKQ